MILNQPPCVSNIVSASTNSVLLSPPSGSVWPKRSRTDTIKRLKKKNVSMRCDTRTGPPNTTMSVHSTITHYSNVKDLVFRTNVKLSYLFFQGKSKVKNRKNTRKAHKGDVSEVWFCLFNVNFSKCHWRQTFVCEWPIKIWVWTEWN